MQPNNKDKNEEDPTKNVEDLTKKEEDLTKRILPKLKITLTKRESDQLKYLFFWIQHVDLYHLNHVKLRQ